MVRQISAIAIAAAALCSCNQLDLKGMIMPTGEGVQARFEQSLQMNSDLKIGSLSVQENYVFYAATDPHINETARNLNTFNDALRNDSEAAFGVVLGDCIDVRDNLPKYLEALAYNPDRHAYDHEIYHVLGNHDLFFKGWNEYAKLLGPSVYWFEVKSGPSKDLFITLDSASGTLGPSVFWFEVSFASGKDIYISLDTATGTLGRKQTEWFRSFLTEKREDYRHCIILTHTNLFYTDNSQSSSGNMPMEEVYSLLDFLGKHKVSLVLQGHDHYREDLTYDNVRYTVLGTIKDESSSPEYLKLNVKNDEIGLEWQMISSL